MKTINAEALENLLIEICAQPVLYSKRLVNLLEIVFTEAPVEKWRPVPNQGYWAINSYFKPQKNTNNSLWDEERIQAGNCYPTEQSCQEAIEKIKKVLAK